MPTIDIAATGDRIGTLRDRAGLNNADIANALGLTTRNAIYKWMNGTSLPSLDNLVALAALFGVGLDDIIITTNRHS